MIKTLIAGMRSGSTQPVPSASEGGDAAVAGRAHGLSRAPSRGFTLLELLIVIALLAILAVVVVLVLNPAETLRRARDSQRISDMSSLKSAIGLYLTDVTAPDLEGTMTTTNCDSGADTLVSAVWGTRGGATDLTDSTITGADHVDHVAARNNSTAIDGTGWVPVNFGSITGGGSPLGALPVDPAYVVADVAAVADIDSLYIYGCSAFTYEINANMEATRNNTDAGNIEDNDGGNDADWAEFGTSLTIIDAL